MSVALQINKNATGVKSLAELAQRKHERPRLVYGGRLGQVMCEVFPCDEMVLQPRTIAIA
jgi:hypothetical protein